MDACAAAPTDAHHPTATARRALTCYHCTSIAVFLCCQVYRCEILFSFKTYNSILPKARGLETKSRGGILNIRRSLFAATLLLPCGSECEQWERVKEGLHLDLANARYTLKHSEERNSRWLGDVTPSHSVLLPPRSPKIRTGTRQLGHDPGANFNRKNA